MPEDLAEATIAELSPTIPTNPSWERVQLARHPKRPHALDYIDRVFTDFTELHGDRAFAETNSYACDSIRSNRDRERATRMDAP